MSVQQTIYLYRKYSSSLSISRDIQTFNSFSCRTEYFKNSIFACVIGEWNKQNPKIQSSGSYNIFRKSTLNFFRSSASKVYNIIDVIDIKLITRLYLSFSHLREHKLKHNFQDTLNPLYSCSIGVESTSHYFLHCHFFDALWATLTNNLKNIVSDLPTLRDENPTNISLYGNQIYEDILHIIKKTKSAKLGSATDRFRNPPTFKKGIFLSLVNGFQSFTVVTKTSVFGMDEFLYPNLMVITFNFFLLHCLISSLPEQALI